MCKRRRLARHLMLLDLNRSVYGMQKMCTSTLPQMYLCRLCSRIGVKWKPQTIYNSNVYCIRTQSCCHSLSLALFLSFFRFVSCAPLLIAPQINHCIWIYSNCTQQKCHAQSIKSKVHIRTRNDGYNPQILISFHTHACHVNRLNLHRRKCMHISNDSFDCNRIYWIG